MIVYKEGNEEFVKTNAYSESQLDFIVKDLKAGCIVALATDTVMGLASTSDSLETYSELKKIKGDRKDKLFPVMVSNLSQLKEIVELSSQDLILIDKWFPGKVTFIFNIKENSNLVGLGETVAVRMPDDKLLLDIVNRLNKPIFLTSANKSNLPPTKQFKEVLDIFDGEISSILMRNALGYQASTIIDATSSGLVLVREGSISLEDVVESLEETWEKLP